MIGSCPMRWASVYSISPTNRSTSCASSTAATKTSTTTVRSTPSPASSPAIWISRGSKRRISLADLAADAGEALRCRLVFVVDIERLGIRTGGLVLLPEAFISEPSAAPGPRVLWIELHRLVEIGRRRLIIADGQIAQCPRGPRFGIAVFQADCSGEVVDGELVLLAALIEQAAIVIGVGIVGLERDCLVEIGERLVGVTLPAIDDAAADISGRIIGVDGQRLVVVGKRQVETVGLAIDQGAIGVGLCVIGIETDCLVEIGERLIVAAGFAVDRSAHIVGLRVLGMIGDDLAERGQVRLRRCQQTLAGSGVGCRRIAQCRATGQRRQKAQQREAAGGYSRDLEDGEA